MSTNQIITDVPLIDYLRLSTFNFQRYLKLTAQIRAYGSGWRPAKWLQYKGQKSEQGIFYGHAEQNKRPHAIIQVSGLQAQKFYTTYKEQLDGWACTRIDVQLTRIAPGVELRPRLYQSIINRKKKASLIQSDTGTTLYIGARTSDTYTRLYDKEDALLRCEFELKGKQAKRAWASLMAGLTVAQVFNETLQRVRLPKLYHDHYHANAEQKDMVQIDETEDMMGKLEWLAQLDGLVYKLANDHDTADRLEQLVSRWYEYATKS